MYKSVTDLHIGVLAERSGLVVRCWLCSLVNEVLVQGANLEPGTISPLPHQSTHLQLCQSVGEKQAANDKETLKLHLATIVTNLFHWPSTIKMSYEIILLKLMLPSYPVHH